MDLPERIKGRLCCGPIQLRPSLLPLSIDNAFDREGHKTEVTRQWAESRRQSQLRCGEPDQAVGQTANGRRTGLRSSACTDEKNVPSPSANMLILSIVNLGTIAETV